MVTAASRWRLKAEQRHEAEMTAEDANPGCNGGDNPDRRCTSVETTTSDAGQDEAASATHRDSTF